MNNSLHAGKERNLANYSRHHPNALSWATEASIKANRGREEVLSKEFH